MRVQEIMEDFAYMSERVVKFQSKEAVIMSTMETMKGTAHGLLETETKLNAALSSMTKEWNNKIDSALHDLTGLKSSALTLSAARRRVSTTTIDFMPKVVATKKS
jgi:hypothetical protein